MRCNVDGHCNTGCNDDDSMAMEKAVGGSQRNNSKC